MSVISPKGTITVDNLLIYFIELFFILGFTHLTYQYNLFVVFGFLPLAFILKKKIRKDAIFYLLILGLLSSLYLFIHDGRSAFRVIKTLVVFIPFFFTNILKENKYTLSSYFYLFMKINALLVCVDFILYFLVGRTIIPFTVSGFIPRPCGLLEDSNFFSYLMLIFIFYEKWIHDKYHFLFIISLLLSGSFSALFCFTILFFLFKNKMFFYYSIYKVKFFITTITVFIIFLYDYFAINSNQIVNFIFSLNVNELIKIKIISLSQRLDTVTNAFSEMSSVQNILFGIGAGKTRELSDIGLNLHNSFLQLFLEMGFVLLFIVVVLLIKMISNIKYTNFIILFCIVLLLGCIMEVFYNPLLSFVYFLSFSYAHSR